MGPDIPDSLVYHGLQLAALSGRLYEAQITLEELEPKLKAQQAEVKDLTKMIKEQIRLVEGFTEDQLDDFGLWSTV